MDATVRNLDGDDADTVEPGGLRDHVPPDLIGRAAPRRQTENRTTVPTSSPALRTPAESFGSGRGMAHVPRQEGAHAAFPRPSRDARRTRRKPRRTSPNRSTRKQRNWPSAARSLRRPTPNCRRARSRVRRRRRVSPSSSTTSSRTSRRRARSSTSSRQRASRTTSNAPTRVEASAWSGESPRPEVQDADIDPFVTSSDRPVASGPEPRRCRRDDGRGGQRGGSRPRRTAGDDSTVWTESAHRGGGRPMSSAIEHPLVTEKAMNDMDFENKLQFVVNPTRPSPRFGTRSKSDSRSRLRTPTRR